MHASGSNVEQPSATVFPMATASILWEECHEEVYHDLYDLTTRYVLCTVTVVDTGARPTPLRHTPKL